MYTDDTTELSSDEEILLANDKLRVIYMEQTWEFLRKKASGVVGIDGMISVPSDFDELMENYSEDPGVSEPLQKVVYIGGSKMPYFVIPMGQRNANQASNVCWYDPSSGKIAFATSPGSGTVFEFDYKSSPDDITVGTSPKLPADYHPMVVFLMLVDEEVIKKSEKARSNVDVNQAQFNRYMKNLKLRDARFKLV